MTPRNRTEIIQSIIDAIKNNPNNPTTLYFQEGSRNNSLVVTFAVQFEAMENTIKSVYDDIHIDTASEEALELKLEDKSLTRLGSLPSQLTLRIGSTTLPTSTITIPQLFQVATLDDTPIIFQTIESGSISAATTPDGDGYYTVDLLAESVEESDRANVSVGTVTNIVSTLTGIDTAKNVTAGTGGRDIESIESMRIRLKASNSNFDRGTKGWFITETLQNFSDVSNVIPIRSPYGEGTVQLIVTGSSPDLTAIKDYFEDEERADAAGWNIVVTEATDVDIDITINNVYRSDTDVDFALLQTITDNYFATMEIGNDFFVNKYIQYLLNNIANLIDVEITVPASARTTIAGDEIAASGTLTVNNYIDTTEA